MMDLTPSKPLRRKSSIDAVPPTPYPNDGVGVVWQSLPHLAAAKVTHSASGASASGIVIPAIDPHSGTKALTQFRFRLRDEGLPATLQVTRVTREPGDDADRLDIIKTGEGELEVLCTAFREDGGLYHLPPDLCRTLRDALTCDVSDAVALPYVAAKAIELLCLTSEASRRNHLLPADTDGRLRRSESQRVLIVWQLIHDRWAEPWNLNSLSRAAGINRSRMTTCFQALFGITVTTMLRERRLEQAKVDLLTSSDFIAQIGCRNGYADCAAFCRAFRRHFGMTPVQVRMGDLDGPGTGDLRSQLPFDRRGRDGIAASLQ